jgi:hypothetical protein
MRMNKLESACKVAVGPFQSSGHFRFAYAWVLTTLKGDASTEIDSEHTAQIFNSPDLSEHSDRLCGDGFFAAKHRVRTRHLAMAPVS